MRKKSEEFIGTYQKDMWRSPDRLCLIGVCEGGMKVVVKSAAEPELIPGMTYRFQGYYEDSKFGKQFKVEQFQIREPNSRKGLTTYLAKYAPNIGPAIASKLYDAFGSDAVMVLRTRPEAVAAACPLLSPEKAEEAAKVLRTMAKLEETKIALLNLFAGRGFPGTLIEECVGKWGILAPDRVRRDPFTLLVQGMTGAGFARCDTVSRARVQRTQDQAASHLPLAFTANQHARAYMAPPRRRRSLPRRNGRKRQGETEQGAAARRAERLARGEDGRRRREVDRERKAS